MELMKHQQMAVERAKTGTDLGLFFEVGTGKTATAITILRNIFNIHRQVVPTLIIGPLAVIYNWKREIAKWAPKIPEGKIKVLTGSLDKRIANLDKLTNDIVITNIDAFAYTKFVDAIMKFGPMVLIVDESHMCKTPNAKRSKNIYQVARRTSYRYILTGTPILNSPMDIFMQFKILDLGKTFGDNFYIFRNKFFHDENAKWSGRQGYFPKFVPTPELFPILSQMIESKSVRALKKDCLDLPPMVDMLITVDLTPEQSKLYKQMKDNFLAWYEQANKASVATIALTKALRLQQIVSGHLVLDDGTVVPVDCKPRLDAVEGILEQVINEHKVIIWCVFKHDYKVLGELLTKMKIKHVFLTGEQNGKEKEEAINSFETDISVRCIIGNRRAGGTGVNLIQASYAITYSRNFSLGDELQSEARNHRMGSQVHEKITKVNICAHNTIDEVITEALKNKQDISTTIIDRIKEVK